MQAVRCYASNTMLCKLYDANVVCVNQPGLSADKEGRRGGKGGGSERLHDQTAVPKHMSPQGRDSWQSSRLAARACANELTASAQHVNPWQLQHRDFCAWTHACCCPPPCSMPQQHNFQGLHTLHETGVLFKPYPLVSVGFCKPFAWAMQQRNAQGRVPGCAPGSSDGCGGWGVWGCWRSGSPRAAGNCSQWPAALQYPSATSSPT